MVTSPAPAAVAACGDVDVRILRVDEEAGVALTLEAHGGSGSGRTRWAYLKHLPQHLLETLQEETIRKSNGTCSTQEGDGGETEGDRDTSPDSSSSASASLTPAWQAVARGDDLVPISEDDENRLIAEALLGLQEGADIGMDDDHGRENNSISTGRDVERRSDDEGDIGTSGEQRHGGAERDFDDAALDGDSGGDERSLEPIREQDSAGRWSDLGAFNSTFHAIENALHDATAQVAAQHKNDEGRLNGERSDGTVCFEEAAVRNNGENIGVEKISLKSGGWSLVEQDSPNADDEHESAVTQAEPERFLRRDKGEHGVRSRTSFDAFGPDGSRSGEENATDQLDETADHGLRSSEGHSYIADFETNGGDVVDGGHRYDKDSRTGRIAERTGEFTDHSLCVSDSSSSSSWTASTPRTSSSRNPVTPRTPTPCGTGLPGIDSLSSDGTIPELGRGAALAGEDACHCAEKRREFDVSLSSSKPSAVPSSRRGIASPVPTITSPWTPRTTVRGIELKKSNANLSGGGEGMAEGAGWGAFCEGYVAQGNVVFEEEALLSVDPRHVEDDVWRVVYTVAQEAATAEVLRRVASGGVQTNNVGLHPAELLQVVAWDNADAAVQDRVLQLFTPEPDSFAESQLAAWNVALESLQQRDAFNRSDNICVPTSTNQAAACGDGANDTRAGDQKYYPQRATHENKNRRDYWGIKRWGGKVMADQSEVGCGRAREKRRSDLLRVLMICEANIFGEEESEPDYERRFLFETACRINHSCLPNCTYTTRDGRMTVRALVDLAPGTELSISYLPFDIIVRDTDTRRDFLLSKKYFWCKCSRCSSKYDLARAFRCPSCHKGAVNPATISCQASHTTAVEQRSSCADSNCAACGTTTCESAAVRSAPAVDVEPAFGSKAFGVSACTDCGRVPTASWLASAVRLEIFVLQALEETFAFDDSRAAHTVPYICAVGMYLFDEHYLRAECHDLMAELLQHIGRFEEAAYHLHEALRIWDAILHRPSRKVGQVLYALGVCLSIITGIQQAKVEQPLFSMQPSSGRCGTFAGLVQKPPPASTERHTLDGEAEQTHRTSNASVAHTGSARGKATVGCGMTGCALNNDADRFLSNDDAGAGGSGCGDDGVTSTGDGAERVSIQTGVCAVCGRRHGRPCDVLPDCASQQDAAEEDDWAVQASGCVHAFRRARDVFSTIYGEEGRETLQVREHTLEIQKLIASQKAQLGYT